MLILNWIFIFAILALDIYLLIIVYSYIYDFQMPQNNVQNNLQNNNGNFPGVPVRIGG